MKMTKLLPLVVAAAAGLAACNDSMSSTQLISDEELSRDIAASAGDAIATSIATIAANEADGGLSGASVQSSVMAANSQNLNFNRTRTCFDASGAVMASCTPISSVRKIVTHVTIDGTRSGSHPARNGGTATWEGDVHRVADDTLVRNFTGSTETSRTHTGVITANDTTHFSNGDIDRTASEAAVDSIKGVTWNVPRSSNPFPVSGSIKRVVSVHIVVTKGSETQTRTFNRTITVSFPADAQGNVTLTINDKTCQLNVVTRAVTNCQ